MCVPVGVHGAAHAREVGQVEHGDARVEQGPLPLGRAAEAPVREVQPHVLQETFHTQAAKVDIREGLPKTENRRMKAADRAENFLRGSEDEDARIVWRLG